MDTRVKILIFTVVAVLGAVFTAGVINASFNEQINYQGKLASSNGIAVEDGQYCMKFRIMDALTDGTELWSETWTASNAKVQVTSGLFSILLGSHTSISSVDFDNASRYLEVQLDATCNGSYEEVFAPRKQFGAVPSAFEAKQLGGATWAAPGTIGSGTANTGAFTTLSASSAFTTLNGSILSSASGVLTLGGAGGTYNENLTFDFESTENKVKINSTTGAATIDFNALNLATTGTGTLGKLVVNTSDLVANAAGYENKVGIGTTTPGNILDIFSDKNSGTIVNVRNPNSGNAAYTSIEEKAYGVSVNLYTLGGLYTSNGQYLAGGFLLENSGAAGTIGFSVPTSGYFPFYINNTEKVRIDSTGNVGIGTTGPNQKLSVAGTLGILEGGDTPTKYSIFQGGDQTDDVTYTLPTTTADGYLKNTSGALSWSTIDVSGYVPYSGATGAVNLGAQNLTTTGIGSFGPALTSTPDSSYNTHPAVATRNDANFSVGLLFNVNSNITISSLGRLYVAGNTQDHAIRLWDTSNTSTPIITATILASSTSDANNFKWVSITPTNLVTGKTYALAIDEFAGGDRWKNSGEGTQTYDAVFTNTGYAYKVGTSLYPDTQGTGAYYNSAAMKYVLSNYNTGALTAWGSSTTTNYAFVVNDYNGINMLSIKNDQSISATGTITAGGFTTVGTTTLGNQLKILEGGSTPIKYTIFQGGDQSADLTYTLPTTSADGYLKNTSGALSWSAIDMSAYLALDQTTPQNIVNGKPNFSAGLNGNLYDSGSVASSQYPPTQNGTYVKANYFDNDTGWAPWNATNPALSLTGGNYHKVWISPSGVNTNQRFHIDLGTAKTITKIYYENNHNAGDGTNEGVRHFTFWGSNSATAFSDLTYGDDTDWTQLTASASEFDQHVALDQADPKYITVTNSTAYRYYAFKFADNWGATGYMDLRRVELQAGVPILSVDATNRKIYGTNGTTAMMDWGTLGTVNFGTQNLTTSGTLGAGAITATSINIGSGAITTSGLGTFGTLTVSPDITTSYANGGGTGDRTASITVTSNDTYSGTLSTTVDGAISNGLYFDTGASSGKYVRFDFGAGASKVIQEAHFYCQNAYGLSFGTAQWQGSNNGSSWTNIGSTFDSRTTVVDTSMSANITGYRYYQVIGVSGNIYDPYVYEVEFKIGDAPGQLTVDASGNFLTTGTGTFTGGIATSYGTVAPTLTTNGQIGVAYVGTDPLIYFQANGTTYHILGSSSFEISPHETVDAVSGEKMKVGDFVVGMIDRSMGNGDTEENSSLHGIWVKWDSVKEELLAEARGELSTSGSVGTGSVSGVSTTTMLGKVKNVLTSLGISAENGITTIKELVSQKASIKLARVEQLEMVDKKSGDIYCTWMEDGEWMKSKGECASAEVATAEPEVAQPTTDQTQDKGFLGTILDNLFGGATPVTSTEVPSAPAEQSTQPETPATTDAPTETPPTEQTPTETPAPEATPEVAPESAPTEPSPSAQAPSALDATSAVSEIVQESISGVSETIQDTTSEVSDVLQNSASSLLNSTRKIANNASTWLAFALNKIIEFIFE